MTDTEDARPGQTGGEEPIPLMQRILDNPFLLLFLGVAMPALLYLIWGLVEIVQIPLAD
jgi:hypothetical protein